MSVTGSSSRRSASQHKSLVGLFACLTAFLLIVDLRCALADRNPCEDTEIEPSPSESVGQATEPVLAASTSQLTGRQDGHLIIQVANAAFLGRPVFAEEKQIANLPLTKGLCVWFALAPGLRRIRINAEAGPQEFVANVVSQRTYLISLREDGDAVSELLPRFAVHHQGATNAFPRELRSAMLDLAARAVPDIMDLSDEYSSLDPLGETGLTELLGRINASCDPKELRKAKLQYVLVLQATPSASPSGSVRFGARVYNTGVGGYRPAAEVIEGDGSGAACTKGGDVDRFQCVIRQALDDARTRYHSCLRISTQPPAAAVSIRPLSASGAAISEAAVQLEQPQPSLNGYVERAVFSGLGDPLRYEIQTKLPHFFTSLRQVDLKPGRITSTQVMLQHLPGPPLHKQWWLWQLVGTAISVVVAGTVAGAYAADGGTK